MGGEKRATCPEKEFEANQSVMIVNMGERAIEFKFDGRKYHFPAAPGKGRGSMWRGPAAVAWHVLGDPDLRPGQMKSPTHGDGTTWNREIERLMHLWGAWRWDSTVDNGGGVQKGRTVLDKNSNWQYILEGNLFWVAGDDEFRGTAYYQSADVAAKPEYVAREEYTESDSRQLPVNLAMANARRERDTRASEEYLDPASKKAVAMAQAAIK